MKSDYTIECCIDCPFHVGWDGVESYCNHYEKYFEYRWLSKPSFCEVCGIKVKIGDEYLWTGL